MVEVAMVEHTVVEVAVLEEPRREEKIWAVKKVRLQYLPPWHGSSLVGVPFHLTNNISQLGQIGQTARSDKSLSG